MIRRVISEPDEMDAMSVTYENAGGLSVDADEGDEDRLMIGKEEEPNQHYNRGESSSDSPPAGAVAPAFVEPDTIVALHRQHHHHQIEAPLSVIDPPLMRRNNDSSSTLSIDQDDDEPLVRLDQHHPPVVRVLARTNSRSSSNSSQVAKSSQNSSRDWGWFEEIHFSDRPQNRGKKVAGDNDDEKKPRATDGEDIDTSVMAVTAPNYVLEESLSTQMLWKESAGQRPPQPAEERAFFEKMWAQNFAHSQVQYNIPVDVLTASSPIALDPFSEGNYNGETNYATDATLKKTDAVEATLVHRMNEDLHSSQGLTDTTKKLVQDPTGEGNLTVLIKGDNVFGTTVSKSFIRSNDHGTMAGIDTINIGIASYRVVESKKHGKFAQFLVIYREGNILNTMGIWKRYSDFEGLAHKVVQAHEGCVAAFANISPLSIAEEPDTEHLPNAITSWRLLKKRQRWYRCLDSGYLSLKVFLLERFLHDILFESNSPHLLRDFVVSSFSGSEE